MISIVVLTYNEEVNLPGCLENVAWCDDVTIFDSFSTDRTVEIARAAGARVVQHPFENYGAQREAARASVDYKHPWLLFLDADERVDVGLKEELIRIDALNPGEDAFKIRMKNHFLGKWIRRSTLYPSWCVRLLRHERVSYEVRSVHEYPVVKTPIGSLKGHLLHYSFNKGLSHWISKHNQYASMEAQENLRILGTKHSDWRGLLSLDPVRRRRALKLLSIRLPFRPTLRFLYMYILRGGFLDGAAGFTYCRLLYFYELMIVLKVKEQRRKAQGLPS
jgi:glycosyltransferase involved in cell wall biosynthesis